MTLPLKILLAFHPANQHEARPLSDFFAARGYEIRELVSGDDFGFSEDLKRADADRILLLFSGNLLTDGQSLFNLFPVWQQWSERGKIVNIVVPTHEINAEKSSEIAIPTVLDRISGIIRYINFWQDNYLELRSKKRFLTDEKEDATLTEQLRISRSISTEIGDFLRLVKESGPLDWDELQAQDFQSLLVGIGEKPGLPENLLELAEAAEQEIFSQKTVKAGDGEHAVSIAELEKMEERNVRKIDSPEGLDFTNLEIVIAEIDSEETVLGAGETDAAAPQLGSLDELFETVKMKLNVGASAAFSEIEQLEILLEKNPEDHDTRLRLAALLAAEAGRYDQAVEQLNFILKNDPKHAEALYFMGELAEVHGDFSAAQNYYEQVAASDSDFPGIYFRLATMLQKHFPDKEEDKAAKFYKKALKKDPDNADVHYGYAALLAESLHKPLKAIEHFQKALDLDARHPFANYDLAVLFFKTGDRKQAEKFYERACFLNPEFRTEENNRAFGVANTVIQTAENEVITTELVAQNPPTDLPPMMPTAAQPERQFSKIEKVNKIVLITGATSGIGRATAEVFAQNGYSLILTGRRDQRLNDLKMEFESAFSTDILLLNFDMRDLEAVETAIASIPEEWQNIDILINNAGLAKGLAPIHEGSFYHWETMIDTNVKGLLYVTRLVAPLMVKNQSGHIVNIGSTAGKEVYPNGNVYCATKFAVDALTKAMRLDLYKHNIRVSQVSPGHVEETEFALVRFDGDAQKSKIYDDFQPLRAADVAEVIYFMVTRPPHVNVQDVLLMSTQQAGAMHINRSGR